jgi:hypothetical protein
MLTATRRLILIIPLLLAGCTSRVTTVHITNDTGAEIRNVEVEYQGGSYGISHLAAGKTHDWRIKPFGDKPLSIAYLDAANKQHRVPGPLVRKEVMAEVNIHIAPDGVHY